MEIIRDDYKFLSVNAAFEAINLKVNLIGTVVDLGFLNDGNSTNCICCLNLKIVDRSHPEPGLTVKFFGRTADALPRVLSPGDITLLSRVTMVLLDGEVTALFNKTFSAFALFHGKDGEDFVPYQCSPSFQMRERDKDFIADLRQWQIYKLDKGLCNFKSLADIKDGEHSNLLCMILHICKDAQNRWFLFSWDGSDTPPFSILSKQHPFPLHVEPDLLPRDVLRKFPRQGSILRVIIDEGNDKPAIHSLKPGQCVKFINVLFQVNSGLWSAICTPSTTVQEATNEEKPVLTLRRRYEEVCPPRLDSLPLAPVHSGITGVDHEDAPFVTLMRLLTYPEVTAKFKCLVRVVAAYPWEVQKFYNSEGKYRVYLALEDATARIQAHVYAEEAVKFFGGHPSDEGVIQKRNKLLGIPGNGDGDEIKESARNPPWVQCCIISYYADKKDMWGTRRFTIFDTWII